MRSPAAYYLLLLYCTVLIRCALPAACDALSHIFNEEQHIATVHAVYGSHHLESQTAGTVDDNHSGKHTASLQQNEPNVVHLFTPYKGYETTVYITSVLYSSFLPCFLIKRSGERLTPPPESDCLFL